MDLDTYYKLIEELEKHRGYGVHTGVEEVSKKIGQPYDATRAIRSQYLQRKSIKKHLFCCVFLSLVRKSIYGEPVETMDNI